MLTNSSVALPRFLDQKRHLAEGYRVAFAIAPRLSFVGAPAGAERNFWLNAVPVKTCGVADCEGLLKVANDAGYQCRPAWSLMHTAAMFGNHPRGDLAVSEALAARLINLPSSAGLGSASV